MTRIDVRSYRETDRAACRRLWVELTQTHRDLYDASHIGGDDPGLLFDEHHEAVGPERLWVAEDAGEVVGLTGFIPRPEGPEIEPVIVARSHRGRGIGRMLVEHVVATLRTAGEDTISVRAVGRNAEALAFYHEMGFRIVAYVELMQDLREGSRPWRPGDPLEGRTFLV